MARRDGSDERVVPQSVHLAPWFEANGNINRVVSHALKFGSPTAREEEARRLRAKGIAIEELQVYVLEEVFVSANVHINTMNKSIVNRLNAIAVLRKQWFVLCKESGHPKDLKNTKSRIKNLKTQIGRLQQDIKSAGGVPVPFPNLFNTMPVV